MNKVIFGLILAVCVLGMALLMLNERLGRKPDPAPVASAPQIITEKEIGLEPAPDGRAPLNEGDHAPIVREMSPEMAQVAREYENREARQALAPPKIDDVVVPDGPRMPIREPADMAAEEPILEPEPMEAPENVPQAAPQPAPMPVQAAKPEPAPQPAPVAKPEPAQRPKPAARPETKPAPAKAETPKPARTDAPKAAGAGTITRFVVFARDKGATIRLNGDRPMRYKTLNLENPDRIVIDIEGDWKFPPRLEVPKNELVNSARVGKNGDKTRLVIDLKEKPRVSRMVPAKTADSLDVRIDK